VKLKSASEIARKPSKIKDKIKSTTRFHAGSKFYRNGKKMMAVDIATLPSFSASTPKVLFEGQYQLLSTSTPNYDVSPDGQRFLMLKPIEQGAQINVVLNWFEELKQKVPAGKT
jgi:hypothetical protein